MIVTIHRDGSEADAQERVRVLETLVDRALKMMEMAGYRVVEHNPDDNNPVVAWMADARAALTPPNGVWL